jgi:bifunctional non-homologous end joining protein LigD
VIELHPWNETVDDIEHADRLGQKLSHNQAHAYSMQLAERLADTNPQRYTTCAAMTDRRGRLFIDFLRNGRGTTAVGPYSPRARPRIPIAAPTTWTKVKSSIRSDAFSIFAPP